MDSLRRVRARSAAATSELEYAQTAASVPYRTGVRWRRSQPSRTSSARATPPEQTSRSEEAATIFFSIAALRAVRSCPPPTKGSAMVEPNRDLSMFQVDQGAKSGTRPHSLTPCQHPAAGCRRKGQRGLGAWDEGFRHWTLDHPHCETLCYDGKASPRMERGRSSRTRSRLKPASNLAGCVQRLLHGGIGRRERLPSTFAISASCRER